ncbi:nuclear transport factor 2 family protein [Jiangella endophytica]|uniref:nuclear transport factor 2 family protein n=1 Tax=Jiangella endophytica TaxID=1623398 RepID=UPI000E34B367|nr:nuclear transport factor 2 family protein [Jiangella endophytica]
MTDGRAPVLHYYETVDSEDPTAVVDLFSEDAVYRRPGYQPMVGRAALLRFYGGERVIAAGRHVITRIVLDGPAHVAVEGRFIGHLKDGSRVDLGFADFFTLHDTLIVERATYFEASAV